MFGQLIHGVVLAWHVPVVHRLVLAALGGAGVAAATDYHAFIGSWHNWHDVATYDWSTATFRWLQGAALGIAGALGLTAIT